MTPAQFKAALVRLKLTQGQAATALGMTVRTISAYANGYYRKGYPAPIPKRVELALRGLTRKDKP